ncbi:MAG: glucosyltransferase domain-containing protein [Oscillospiraceae bacterium]|nr:glucosyltransferase domain-containing protein [Oscillospiraceae bacterium]
MSQATNRCTALVRSLPERLRPDRLPFCSAFFAGLLAHGFAFANMLLNSDEISSLFGKGMTVASGRWGLELSSLLFPDVSMPWIFGLFSLLMLSAAACLLLRIFQIRSPLLGCVLAALVTVFPAQTATFSYMFTAPSFALAFLLATAAVWLTERESRAGWLGALLLLLLSVSIYQAYIAVASSFFVLRMLQKLLKDEGSAKEILLFGLKRLALLALTLGLYYLSIHIALYFYGGRFENYGVERERSMLFRIAVAYSAFLHTFTRGYFHYVRGLFSQILHALCLGLTAFVCLRWLLRCRDLGKALLFLLCLLLFPLSMYCIYLIAETGVIHAMVLYSFISVYVFAVLAAERLEGPRAPAARRLLALCLALVALGNCYFANAFYLKLHLRYENAYALYTGLAAQIRQTPGFDGNTKLAILGSAGDGLYGIEELDELDLIGKAEDLANVYTREQLVRRFVGFDVPFADEEERAALQRDPRVLEMPVYPAYGSVQLIDGYIVVRLGD